MVSKRYREEEMIMNRIFILTVVLACLFSCGKTEYRHSLSIKNSELEKAIIDFADEKKKLYDGREFVVNMRYWQVNDSISRCGLYCDFSSDSWDYPFEFVSKAGDYDVLVTMMAGYDRKRPLFRMRKEDKEYFMKKYFPEEYSLYKAGKKVYPPQIRYKKCIITFLYGRIIDKRMEWI
jgi:hypothetical protein